MLNSTVLNNYSALISCIVDAFLCSLLYCTSAESYYTELHCTELYWTVPYSTELVLYFSATNLVFWIAHMHISLLLKVSFLSHYLSVICPWLLSSFLIIYIQITIESVSFLSLIYTAPLPPPGFILFVTVHFSCNFPTYCSTILSFLSSPLLSTFLQIDVYGDCTCASWFQRELWCRY